MAYLMCKTHKQGDFHLLPLVSNSVDLNFSSLFLVTCVISSVITQKLTVKIHLFVRENLPPTLALRKETVFCSETN